MVGKLRALLVIVLCLPLVGAWPNTGRKYPSVAAAYVGPGDVLAGGVIWWGLRAFNNTGANSGASTTKVIDVLGTSTVTGCTIFLKGNGTGDLDLTTSGPGGVGNQCAGGATTFCTVTNTTCSVSKFYDQSGASQCSVTCDVAQSTAANQPTLAFNCIGTKPCLKGLADSSNVFTFVSGNISNTYTIPYSFSSVSATNGTGCSCVLVRNNFVISRVTYESSTSADIHGGTDLSATYSTSVKAARNDVINGASSVINVNGTETTGNAGSNSILATTTEQVFANGSTTFLLSEIGIWSVGFSGANRTALCKNQQAYYGAANFGAAC